MNRDLLEILVCPACSGALQADPATATLETGTLSCLECSRSYPVVRGIPRLLVSGEEASATARRFGYSWKAYRRLWPEDRRQFLDWIHPVTPEFFRGKRVLDLGCGKGRHTVLAHRFGARRVVGVDLSEAVEVAREHTRDLEGVDILCADLLQLPFRPEQFDYVFCIGVLHHLEEPFQGLLSAARQVRREGHLSLWVYSREGNGWIRNLVDPLRRAARWIPSPLLQAAARVLAAVLFLVVQGIYVPLDTLAPRLARRLFYADYLLSLGRYPYEKVEGIVFDQLAAPVTHYISRNRLLEWVQCTGLEWVRCSWLNANSWRAFLRVPPEGVTEPRGARRRHRA